MLTIEEINQILYDVQKKLEDGAPPYMIEILIKIFQLLTLTVENYRLKQYRQALIESLSGEQIPTEYYINIETGDAMLITYKANRPLNMEFVKVSEACYRIHTR